jgi:hypothetical protein
LNDDVPIGVLFGLLFVLLLLSAFFSAGKVYGPDERGGTNDMVRRAHRAGVPVDIYEADARAWRKP